MAETNRQDIFKMQRDAEQRLREMQRRADRAVQGSDMPPVPNFRKTDGCHNEVHGSFHAKHEKRSEPEQKGIKGINLLRMLNFDKLKLDKDIMLIVVMILLLSSEESDELLLLALMYIML